MYTKQILSSNKNPAASPPQNLITHSGMFTSQAIKTGSKFYSHTKLLKDSANNQDNSPNQGSSFSKAEPKNLENIRFTNYKPVTPVFHSHNLSESPEEMKVKKKNSDFSLKKSPNQNEGLHYKKPFETFEESKPRVNVTHIISQNEVMVNKKTNDEEEVKSIPCFETKIKESNKSLHNPEFKKNEFSPKLFSPSFSKLKSEDLVIKNQDTGERFYIDDINQVAKLQEQGKTAEYLEKLKKRKKEEIWQDWWTEKKKINQELMTAIKSNNIAMVKKLFEENQDDKKPEINSKDEKDWTCLHFACLSGNYDMVLELIKLEAEIDSQTNLKQTPLIIAAQKGYENVVSLLLTTGSNINHQDLSNNTALHYSSIYGYKGVVKVLLANPCINVTLINLENKTALEATSFQEIKKWIETTRLRIKQSLNISSQLSKNISLTTLRAPPIERDIKHFSPEVKKRSSNKNIDKEKYEDLIKPLFKINDRTLSNITFNSAFHSNSTSVSENDSTLFLFNDLTLEKEKIGIHSFDLISLIGKGSFGEVYLVEKKSSHELFALKVLSKDKIISNNLVKYAITERNVLGFCSHPFIVKLHAAFQTQDHLFLLLTYCPGGDLAKYILKEKRFPEYKAKFYASEILLALEHLHKKDIIYRDLKPDNIVIDSDGHALLTDFGLSREGVYDQLVAKSFCGSIAYLAPEMLRKQGHGKAVDWYLLGVLIYEMLVGVPPFYSSNRAEIFENIEKGSLKFPNNITKEAKGLMMRLLEKDPVKRLGSGPGEAKEIMDHAFFKEINWEDLINRKKSPGVPYLMKKVNKMRKVDLEEAFHENQGRNSEEIQGWSFVEKQN